MSERIEMVARQNVLGKDVMVYGSAVNPLFLAKDVAEWIDHSDVSMMMKNVDEDEKVEKTNPNNACGGQTSWFLTENGLYEVLMLSRKPLAKQFKKEVKHILHELRVNGTVVSARVAMASPEEQAVSFQKALESAMQHAFQIADSHYLPQIENLRREKAWISEHREAVAVGRLGGLTKKINQLKCEVDEKLDEIDDLQAEKDRLQYGNDRYWGWRSKVGRPRKGYVRPEDEDRMDLF